MLARNTCYALDATMGVQGMQHLHLQADATYQLYIAAWMMHHAAAILRLAALCHSRRVGNIL